MVNRIVKSILLNYNETDILTTPINIPFPVKKIYLKQVSVVTGDSAPLLPMAIMKTNLVENPSQSLCTIPLVVSSMSSVGLMAEFHPGNRIINGDYTFSLLLSDQQNLTDSEQLKSCIGLMLEFVGYD